jgi:hypothetical protein
MNESLRLFFGLFILFLSLGLPAQDNTQSRERTAFDNATSSLTKYRKTGVLGDTEIQWAKSLKVLSLSTSPQADQLLAQLGLFVMDGAVAEEFSCAVSRRGKSLPRQLRRQLKTFITRNVCKQIAFKEGLPKETLCRTKEQFANLVFTFRDVPRPDTEGACDD